MKIQNLIIFIVCLNLFVQLEAQHSSPRPNIILVFIDDMGYGDVSINQPDIKYTPNFQYVADHGVVLEQFYVAQSVCTASRTSLMTGCYANRIGMGGAIDQNSIIGIHPDETTVAEMLKDAGYNTAAIGKWHLGFHPPFLPSNQGFETFFGIPYSHDMWPSHPQTKGYYPPLPVYENNTIIDTVEDASWLTHTFTQKAVEYIRQDRKSPFFLYLAHPLPHVPLAVSESFLGSTGKGLYADVIHEIDASIGQILKTIREKKMEENTLLIVTSDNGPWLAYGNHAGSTSGLREGKGTSWEGGVRVPFVAYWKGTLPERKRIQQYAMTIDLFPTLAYITDSALPQRKIDGENIWPLLKGEQKAENDRPLFFYYNQNDLEAMRWKQWKMYFPHTYRTTREQKSGLDGIPGPYKMVRMDHFELYDLSIDPFEINNVYAATSPIVQKMNGMAGAMREKLGDDLTQFKGTENRLQGKTLDWSKPSIPFWNDSLPFELRANDIVSRLTLEEKVHQMMHRAPAIPRLGIQAYDWWNEALHGVARTPYNTTVFPQAIGLAATWDKEAIRRMGEITSTEGRAIYNHTVSRGLAGYKYCGLTYWSPNINIFRDPRWGRGQETYGEDPVLTATIGSAYVNGIQGDHPQYLKAATCAKHFAVHSGPEPTRHSDNVNPSDYDLWDTYLPAFEALVTRARVQGIMCAYNAFQNQPCCASDALMQQILRKKWGFTGYVTSDCWGLDDFVSFHKTHADKKSAAVDALIHGTDLECGQDILLKLSTAVKLGEIPQSAVDTAVRRLFLTRLRLGLFDSPKKVPFSNLDINILNTPEHRQHALEVAQKSIVLLKNENQALPLSKNIRKVAVLGPNAENAISILGNYTGLPSDPVTIAEGIRRKSEGRFEVLTEQGVDFTSDTIVEHAELEPLFRTPSGQPGIWAEYFDGQEPSEKAQYQGVIRKLDNYWLEGQAPVQGISNFYYSSRFTTVLTTKSDSTLQLMVEGDDGYRLYINDQLFVDSWKENRGEPVFFTLNMQRDTPVKLVLEHRQTEGPAFIRLKSGSKIKVDLDQMVRKYQDADVIIFAGGISPQLEGEELKVHRSGFLGGDRTTIELPDIQRRALRAFHKAGKKVVFVVMTGSALALSDEDETVSAIVSTWYGGQSAGTALADVLFGDVNPAGRLPVTFYASDDDLPPFKDYSMENRTYRYFKGKPLYPFGYGLSYTTFTYSGLKVPPEIYEGDSATVQVTVTNTGKMAGDEVVQCYLSHMDFAQKAPVRALKAFNRIHLQPGESREVLFTLSPDDFRMVSEAGDKVWNPGIVRISAGGGQPEVARATSGNVLTGNTRLR